MGNTQWELGNVTFCRADEMGFGCVAATEGAYVFTIIVRSALPYAIIYTHLIRLCTPLSLHTPLLIRDVCGLTDAKVSDLPRSGSFFGS